MDSSRPSTQRTRLLHLAVTLVDEIQKEPDSKSAGGHCRRIQLKFNHVVGNMTCAEDIVATLFEKVMISQRELDDIHSVGASPTRANEELLYVILRKDIDVYEGFLQALVDTKQLHIYKLLISEVEDCSTIHSDVIRRNYKQLVEKLEPSSGLVYILFEKRVLSVREVESINADADTFKKNDKLLSLISRKCCDVFQIFLLALKDTNQMNIYSIFVPLTKPVSGSTAERTRDTDKPRVPPHSTQRAISSPGTTVTPVRPQPPRPPTKQKSSSQIRTVVRAIQNIGEKRTLIRSLRKKLPEMCDEHQSEIALKVIAIRQGKNYTTSDVLDNCLVKVLKGFNLLKKETQEMILEKAELRQFIQDFVQKEYDAGDTVDDIAKLKREIFGKNMEIAKIRSETRAELQKLSAEVKTLRQNIKMEKATSDRNKQENKKLIKDKSKLEDVIKRLKAGNKNPTKTRLKYKENPILLKKIEKHTTTKADGLSRLAILEDELYVVPLKVHEMEVYDLATLKIKKRWPLDDDVENVEDIASCDQTKCLYMVNWNKEKNREEILKLDRNGAVLKRWLTSEDQGRLSVTYDANIILTVSSKNRLIEYSSDGQLQREINLPSEIKHPQHARKLTNGRYVFSYGSSYHSDAMHGVCMVDAQGNVLTFFSTDIGSSVLPMNHPMYLAVDGESNILVADLNNSRVLLLNSNLQFLREIVSEKHGLRHPRRICLDESNGRLIVACGSCPPNQTDSDVGQVLLFDVRER